MLEINESLFYAKARVFFDELMRDAPGLATQLGDHRYDDRLADFTPEGVRDQRKRLGEWLARFRSMDAAGWSADAKIDLTLTIHTINAFVRQLDVLRLLQRDPGNAANECLYGVYSLIIREFAPLPQRLKSILGRLRAIPKTLADGRGFIVPAEVPPVWAEVAAEVALQGIGLFTGLLPPLADGAPELKPDILAAAEAAASALKAHAEWIKSTVMPQAKGTFAAGKAVFDAMLREDHMVDYDSESLLKEGWRLYNDTERQLRELASRMDPAKSAKELVEESKKNHPTAAGLLDAYKRAMADAKRFVVERGIATIPAGESIRIESTPAFQRALLPFAAYSLPGYFEKAQEGIFWVTPVDEGASAEAAEKKLRGHPIADIPVTALHEAYPGHHLQLVVANTIKSLPRIFGVLLSTLFVEGWAFYCEELMEQLGYINQPIQKLQRLQAQLWRAARIVIDVSLHTKGMTVDEAIRFLVEKAWLEPDDAKAEVRRYTQSPTQPQSYLMGKIQILDIVAEYKKRNPQAGMRQMHDAILGCGSLPPRPMRQKLFKVTIAAAAGAGAPAKPAAPKKAATKQKKPAALKKAAPGPKKKAKPKTKKPALKKKKPVRRPAPKKAASKKKAPARKRAARKAAPKKKAPARKPAPKKKRGKR